MGEKETTPRCKGPGCAVEGTYLCDNCANRVEGGTLKGVTITRGASVKPDFTVRKEDGNFREEQKQKNS